MSSSQVRPHPIFAERLAALAERMIAVGQWSSAAELLEMAATLTPRGDALRRRAEALRDKQPPEDPERTHKRHNLEASHAVGMARIFESRGDLARAQAMFDLAKLRAPFHYLAYAGAGYLCLRRHELRPALEEFAQARRLNPLDRKLAVETARVALELEDYGEALRHAIDALLLSQGLSDSEEGTDRRRVATLASLCRVSDLDLEELYAQRAAAMQRAAEQVALTRARLFTAMAVRREVPREAERPRPRKDLLHGALQLRRFRIFSHLSDPQLMALTDAARSETFRHATVLIREGQDDRDLLFILAGTVHTCRSTPIGTQVLASAGAGDLVGELSFLDGMPRSCTVLGVEGGVALRFPYAAMEAVTAADNELKAALLRTFWYSLSAKVRSANAAMTELVAPGAAVPSRSGAPHGERTVVDPEAMLSLLREQGLSAGELRLLATYAREERFAPEQLIFAEGEPGDTLYIVVDGRVRISREMQGLGEEALVILDRGEVFGEMALIDDQPRSADAKAHDRGATVFAIDRRRLQEVLEMDPDASAQFLTLLCRLLCRRLRAMNDRLVAWRVMASHG